MKRSLTYGFFFVPFFVGCIINEPASPSSRNDEIQKEVARPLAKPGYSFAFQHMPGRAKDIGIGHNGDIWCTGKNDGISGNQDDQIYKWNGSTWIEQGGLARRIAVEPNGTPWVVNSSGSIFKRVASAWQKQPGGAKDIGIGANGAVWIVGENETIYAWNGSSWTSHGGAARRIAVAPDGTPWVVNSSGSIYKKIGANWTKQPGEAQDIAIGGEGSVLVTGKQQLEYGIGPDGQLGFYVDYNRPIYKWTGSGWQDIGGEALELAANPNGDPWVVREGNGYIYRGY